MKASLILTAALFMFAAGSAAAGPAGDPAAGEKVFKKCAACHAVGENAKNRVGPVLNGVVGRPAGSHDGYTYSNAMQAKAAGGLVWDSDKLFDYLADPSAYLGGRSKMPFKLKSEQDRRDVIAYLKQFAADGSRAE